MTRYELINFIILNSKMSLEEISQNIGVNRSNIYLWRKGKSKPKTEHINKLCEISNIDITWINKDNIELNNKVLASTMSNDKKQEDKKIIQLQDETIKLLKEKIDWLEKKNKSKKSLEVPNEEKTTSCNFQIFSEIKINQKVIKSDISSSFRQLKERKVTGNTSCLGFTNKEIEKMSEKKLLELYHPNSLNDGVYNTMLSLSDNSNEMLSVKGLRMLKSKKGAYITFDCKAYFERNENDNSVWKISVYYDEIKMLEA